MRERLTFDCEGAALCATLDHGDAPAGLLILSGGNEIRIGAHRGMARLARDVAADGHPVFRFDRRGVGDSEGENGGFESSAPDLVAALSAFRSACPSLRSIVAFGNCDAATALLLHQPGGIAAHVLTNIWVIEASDDMPPPAAIRARYAERLRDPRAWLRLLTGAVDLRKLASGLRRVAAPQRPSSLSARVAAGLATIAGPVTILLAGKDNTAIAFADAWQGADFAAARARTDISLRLHDSGSHSFASDADYQRLLSTLIESLRAA